MPSLARQADTDHPHYVGSTGAPDRPDDRPEDHPHYVGSTRSSPQRTVSGWDHPHYVGSTPCPGYGVEVS